MAKEQEVYRRQEWNNLDAMRAKYADCVDGLLIPSAPQLSIENLAIVVCRNLLHDVELYCEIKHFVNQVKEEVRSVYGCED